MYMNYTFNYRSEVILTKFNIIIQWKFQIECIDIHWEMTRYTNRTGKVILHSD